MQILCPYCDYINDEDSKRCKTCNNKLEGVEYLKRLVRNFSNYNEILKDGDFQSKQKEFFHSQIDNTGEAFEAITKFVRELEALTFTELKMAISRHNILRIDDYALRNELKRISKIELQEYNSELKPPSFYLSSDDMEEYGDELIDNINSYEVFDREVEFGTLIIGVDTPKHLKAYLDELKSTFAFGLYTAAVMICRSLIELCLRESLHKRRILTFEQVKSERKTLSEISNICYRESIIDKTARNTITDICEKANLPIHEAEQYEPYTKNEAILIIRDSFTVIEHIYSGDKKKNY